MYIIGHYDTLNEDIVFNEKTFDNEVDAAENIEETFETICGKDKDINISNILQQPTYILHELYQISVKKEESSPTTVIKVETRKKVKGYIYNSFTEFKLRYIFFITKVAEIENDLSVSVRVSPPPPEEDLSESVMAQFKQKLVFKDWSDNETSETPDNNTYYDDQYERKSDLAEVYLRKRRRRRAVVKKKLKI